MVNKLRATLSALGIAGGLLALALAGVSLFTPQISSDTLVIPNTFSVGQVADPSTVNANFSAIAAIVNGNIDNDNWDSAGPDLAYVNVALTDSIVLADLKANSVDSTKIVDSAVALADANSSILAAWSEESPCDAADSGSLTTGVWNDRVTFAYTPDAATSILQIHFSGYYWLSETSGSNSQAEFEIQVDGVTICTHHWRIQPHGTTGQIRETIQMNCLVTAPNAGPFDIVVRDKQVDQFFEYFGAVEDCRLEVLELKSK